MAARGQQLFERLDKKIDAELRKKEIFPIANYGWLDAYTEDPELIGHAMWQTRPPIDFTFSLAEEQREPTSNAKHLTIIGADFEGLMELSRTSLGMVLWRQNEPVQDYFADHAKYWAHYTGTLLSLSMASDRLRDFFVIAYFESTFSTHQRAKQEFGAPFLEADQYPHQEVTGQVKKLLPLIEQIQRNRSIRNKLVHRIATRPGKMNQEMFNSRRRTAPPDHTGRRTTWEQWVARTNQELAESAEFVAAWYKTLVNTSSLIFEIEHLLRRKRLESGNRSAV